jgi:hypothetical protein
VHVRGIVATLAVAIAGLIGVGAGGHSDPPAVATRVERRGPIVGTVPMVDLDEQYAVNVQVAAYLAAEWAKVTAYLDAIEQTRLANEAAAWAAAHPPPAVARAPQQAAPNSGTCAGNVECFLACTIGHESASAGVYIAVSPGGTYRGAYQFDSGTWHSNAIAAGYGQWANTPVDQVPGNVQDAVAAYLYSIAGNRPWGGRC